MRLLRTIRLDPSDTFIFSPAAAPGEWAISGAFVFSDVDPAALSGKDLAAFRSGFLGVPSLGWSTLAQVVETDPEQRRAAIEAVARCLLARFGAPDLVAARKAAEEEIDFAASLCVHPSDTLIAVHRTGESGSIRESFRNLRRSGDFKTGRVFSFIDAETEDEPADLADRTGWARGERR